MENKEQKLKEYISSLKNVAVAFSGGVNSALLLKIAHNILGERAVAVTAESDSMPRREFKETVQFCKDEGITQIICRSSELKNEKYVKNPENRCYYCKKEIFTAIKEIAFENDIEYIAEGSNASDLREYRPSLLVCHELGILSPLRATGFFENEVRELARNSGVSVWNKPCFSCLASRIPYNEEITLEKLQMIELSEQVLYDLGFHQFRVRHHGTVARIEIMPEEFQKCIEYSEFITEQLKMFGFTYVSLDLQGYRAKSMIEALK